MKSEEKVGRGLRPQDDSAYRSLASRNRKSQSLLAVAVVATVVGAFLTAAVGPLGVALLAVALPVAVATTVWCVRNWEY